MIQLLHLSYLLCSMILPPFNTAYLKSWLTLWSSMPVWRRVMQDRISNCDGLLVFVSVFSSVIQYYISIMESVLTMVSYSYVSNVHVYFCICKDLCTWQKWFVWMFKFQWSRDCMCYIDFQEKILLVRLRRRTCQRLRMAHVPFDTRITNENGHEKSSWKFKMFRKTTFV